MDKHIETELLTERSYYTLLPLVHKEYPDLKIEDIKIVIDSIFLEISHYIDDNEEILIKDDKHQYFKFYNPSIEKNALYVYRKIKFNRSREKFFEDLSTLHSIYGKNKTDKYF